MYLLIYLLINKVNYVNFGTALARPFYRIWQLLSINEPLQYYVRPSVFMFECVADMMTVISLSAYIALSFFSLTFNGENSLRIGKNL